MKWVVLVLVVFVMGCHQEPEVTLILPCPVVEEGEYRVHLLVESKGHTLKYDQVVYIRFMGVEVE